MKHAVYEIQGNRFIIIDDELGINLSGPLEQVERERNQESYYSKGQLHGPSKYFSKTGSLLSLTWFYHGMRVGKVHRYYPNGQLYCIQRYLEGQPHLMQEYFYPNGTIKTMLEYQYGKYHGKIQLYWPNGILKRECIFSQGIKTGLDNIYDGQGNLLDEQHSE